MASKSLQNIVTILVVVFLIAILTMVAYKTLLVRPGADTTDNPYAYDIDKFKTVPAEMLHYEEKASIPCNNPLAISIYNDGTIYVLDDQSVISYDEGLNKIGHFTVPANAICMAIDSLKQLYLGYEGLIRVYNESANPLRSIEIGAEHSIITSIAIASDHVYAADMGQQAILKLDTNGNLVSVIGKRNLDKDIAGFLLPSPCFDVALDSDGFIWAANTGYTRLENYTPAGDLRAFWGESSMDLEGFSGCCNPAHFCLLEDGSFVTSEKGLARVKVYDRAGQLVSVVAGPNQFSKDAPAMDLAADKNGRIYVVDPGSKSIRIFSKKAS